MKYLKALALVALLPLLSCNEEETTDEYTYYVPVTVVNDGSTTFFMTDKDYLLYPSNLSACPLLSEMRRASISFVLDDVSEDDIVPNTPYNITLCGTSGTYYEIPSYTNWVDVSSEAYKTNGSDSLYTQNGMVTSLYSSGESCFLANGYLNIYPTFDCLPTEAVYMALYYDSTTDVSDGAVHLYYYFDNKTTVTSYTYHGLVSLQVPGSLYGTFLGQGLEETDSVNVSLTAKVDEGVGTISMRVPVIDLLNIN